MDELVMEPVFPEGRHTAWASEDGMVAEVRQEGKVYMRYRGETAYQDATRKAGDLNQKDNIKLNS